MGYNKIPLALRYNDTTNNAEGLIEFQLNLSDVGDVCSSIPSQGQGLVWSGGSDGSWCPSTLPAGGGTPTLPGGSNGDLLINTGGGATYLASAASDAGIMQLDPYFTADDDGAVAQWDGTKLDVKFPDALFIRVTSDGEVISKGDAVYATTTAESGGRIYVGLANASDPTKMPAIGIAEANIAADGNGKIITFGRADGVNTQLDGTAVVGDTLYVGTTPGKLAANKPDQPTELIQNVGIVTEATTNGRIKVTGVGRSNDIPNTITVGTGDSKTTIHVDGTSLGNTEPNSVVITDSSASGYASGLSGVSGELVYFEGSPARPGTQSINQVLTNAGISFVNPSRILAYNTNSVTIAGENSSYPRWSVTSTNAVDQANSDITIGAELTSSGVTFNTAGDYQIDCAVTTSGTGAYTTNCLLAYDDGESGFTDISESVSYSYGSTSKSTAHITSIISAGAGSLIVVKVTPNSSVNLLTDGTTLRILRLS